MLRIITASERIMGRWGWGGAFSTPEVLALAQACSAAAPTETATATAAAAAATCNKTHTTPHRATLPLLRGFQQSQDPTAITQPPSPSPWSLTTSAAPPLWPSHLHARSLTTSPSLQAEMRFPVPRRLRETAAAAKKPRRPQPPAPPPAPRPETNLPPLQRIDPFDLTQQTQLTLNGRHLTGDPGSPRWGAPYYIPHALQHGILPVLLADPWPAAQDHTLRRRHAQLLVDLLRAAPRRMSAREILKEVHVQHGRTFGSLRYMTQLLEHLRTARMIRGALNPEARVVGPGTRDYPLLYYANKYQQEDYGSPAIIQRNKQAQHEAAVAHALKRLRRRKPPYPIHRRRAFDSALHHELSQIQIRQALEQQQQQQQQQQKKQKKQRQIAEP